MSNTENEESTELDADLDGFPSELGLLLALGGIALSSVAAIVLAVAVPSVRGAEEVDGQSCLGYDVVRVDIEDEGPLEITAAPSTSTRGAFDGLWPPNRDRPTCGNRVAVETTSYDGRLDTVDDRYGLTGPVTENEDGTCTFQRPDGTLDKSLCAWVPVTADGPTGCDLEQQINAELPEGFTWSLEDADPELVELRIEDLEAAR